VQQDAKLIHINALHGAITFSLVVFSVSVPAILLAKFYQLFDPNPPVSGTGWAIWLVVLLANTMSAFVLGGVLCVAFNLVARVTGGLQYRVRVHEQP
jgi:hypothetical protein